MILVKPSFKILGIYPDNASSIEKIGRTCYKSEDKITKDSVKTFIKNILKNGHESVIEHSAVTIKFIVDRGVSHELVRHRLCAFSQESTRYCNYKGGCTFVIPPWITLKEGNYDKITDYVWANSMIMAEQAYNELLDCGWSLQRARSVLPNSLKTEITMTASFREWRHIFKLHCSKAAHPQMREIMIPLHQKLQEIIPVIFDDITY